MQQTLEHTHPYLGPKAEMQRFQLTMLAHLVEAQAAAEAAETPPLQEFEIDLTGTDDFDFTDQMALKKELSQRGLYGTNFGYSAFHPKLIDRLRETGTYYAPDAANSNEMWCCLVLDDDQDGTHISADIGNDVIGYMVSNANRDAGYIAIYDLNHMELEDTDGCLFIFKDPTNRKSTLRAIVRVKLT